MIHPGACQRLPRGAAARSRPPRWLGYTLGVLLGRQGEYVEAIAAFTKCLGREPDRIEVCYALGVTDVAQGDRVRAFEVYERLRALDATDAEKFLRDEKRS